MKNYCDKCEKPIKIHEHFFTVTSNNPESFKSYDTVKKEYHEHCIKGEIYPCAKKILTQSKNNRAKAETQKCANGKVNGNFEYISKCLNCTHKTITIHAKHDCRRGCSVFSKKNKNWCCCKNPFPAKTKAIK